MLAPYAGSINPLSASTRLTCWIASSFDLADTPSRTFAVVNPTMRDPPPEGMSNDWEFSLVGQFESESAHGFANAIIFCTREAASGSVPVADSKLTQHWNV